MTVLMAIDPGPEQSAWVVYDDGIVRDAAISPNDWLRQQLRHLSPDASVGGSGFGTGTVTRLVIEKVESFGMAVGAEVFETVYWSGRFAEAAQPLPVDRIGRRTIKVHLCGTAQAKDPNIRQALLDRYGGPSAKGTKKAPGPLYGIANDLWSALAVAVTAGDLAA